MERVRLRFVGGGPLVGVGVMPDERSSILLIWARMRVVMRERRAVGYGEREGEQRSVVQARVRSWWSVDVEVSAVVRLAAEGRETEARMSEMSTSMFDCCSMGL